MWSVIVWWFLIGMSSYAYILWALPKMLDYGIEHFKDQSEEDLAEGRVVARELHNFISNPSYLVTGFLVTGSAGLITAGFAVFLTLSFLWMLL